ncbi:MAG TPA: HAMP domain-containing histidine kinase [Clostridiales bacterium]|nr:HAMP domain-containing histidine kinase [Clostridiales bacterium]
MAATKGQLLEIIRRILRKIVLPIRRRKERWLGSFRLSMAFRISMAYMKLMLTHGILFIFGFIIIYMYSEKINFDRMADTLVDVISEEPGKEIFNPYIDQGLTVRILNKNTKSGYYNDCDRDQDIDRKFTFGIHYAWKDDLNILIIKSQREFLIGTTPYIAQFRYDLSDSYVKCLDLAWKLVLLYLLIVCLVIRKGTRSDVKLFEPVRVMSATANRLTANNLHSERLNVEGTKNELKDLANVINAMLDRIETSYESQKQFVSDASHELRTPIAVIQGYANLLNRWGTTDPEILHESIEAIQNESRSMQDLVEKLLFLSRHDKKTLKLIKKRFNMSKLVEDMVKETKLVADNRVIEGSVMENVIVYGDKQALKQAIRIFIDNAVKYSRDGDTVTIKCEMQNGDCVITVQDTGIGMTQKDIDHIFDRFYRSDYVRNQNIGGHGLGLSLAKLIILAHTGKIKVRSQFKKGTSFIITLPKRRM